MHPADYKKLVYGVKEAAAATGFSRAFLFEKIRNGELRSFKISARRCIASEDLQAWINSYRNGEVTHAI